MFKKVSISDLQNSKIQSRNYFLKYSRTKQKKKTIGLIWFDKSENKKLNQDAIPWQGKMIHLKKATNYVEKDRSTMYTNIWEYRYIIRKKRKNVKIEACLFL